MLDVVGLLEHSPRRSGGGLLSTLRALSVLGALSALGVLSLLGVLLGQPLVALGLDLLAQRRGPVLLDHVVDGLRGVVGHLLGG